ncbi:hypothetical protein [Streptomyces atratus]|uniref:hypothetical protein n=1 Tax=Streptomyces atratus TaxID=1893 RepID=UPI0036541541
MTRPVLWPSHVDKDVAAWLGQTSRVPELLRTRSVTTAQTTAPPHRQGWARICRLSGRRCVHGCHHRHLRRAGRHSACSTRAQGTQDSGKPA